VPKPLPAGGVRKTPNFGHLQNTLDEPVFRGKTATFAVVVIMAESPTLYVILGPTASGKSALAMELARRMKGEILSVDSMQVYKGMDIGTAKPTAADQEEIRHHLIDLVTPDQEFTVARFVELADVVIADAAARRVPLIATGGTPLYYKALFEGLFEGPGGDESIRRRLAEQSNEVLHTRLREVDPPAAARIHVNDHKRLLRALEVFELTGKPISSFQTHWTNPTPRHAANWIGLDWEKEAINRRINARTRAMLAAGWVDEVRSLLAAYPTLSKTAGEATGYRELIDHVRGTISLDDAAEQIKIATRQLARRQMKWFRRFAGVTWLGGDQPVEKLVEQLSVTPVSKPC
jgi:tRNA dimethylallyltransferase